MAIEQQWLLFGAVMTALISLRNWRGLLWIVVAGWSFIASTLYARAGFPYPEAATAFFDVLVCFAVYFVARERWEIYLFLLFQGSVLVSTAYLAGVIGPHWAYIAALEGINWLALGVIGGTSLLGLVNNAVGSGHWAGSYLHGADRALRAHVHTPFRGR